DEQAGSRIARHDRRPRVAAPDHALTPLEDEAPLGLRDPGTVAGGATPGQDGPDGLLEEFDPLGVLDDGRLGAGGCGRTAIAHDPEAHEAGEAEPRRSPLAQAPAGPPPSSRGDGARHFQAVERWSHRQSLASVSPARTLLNGV